MLIRDLEQQTGLDRATIRFYEKEGLIAPERKENGYRVYSKQDAEDLNKIKLLRQLGVGLETIKNIRQGSEDFSEVMNVQLEALEKKITSYNHAKFVCRKICDDRVSYSSMDAAYYLDMLNNPAQTVGLVYPGSYKEAVNKPFHPWRRFFARAIDYSLLNIILKFVLVVVLRIRPFNIPNIVFNYICVLLMIPVEALMIHLWGTTPGKWTMGIRIESSDGGQQSFQIALRRAYWVFRLGCGWYIPFWDLWCNWRSYQAHKNGEILEWDAESEIFYSNWTRIEKAALVFLVAVSLGINFWITQDLLLPTHRYTHLTMDQFVENYTDLEESLGYNPSIKLDTSGKWKENDDNSIKNIIGDTTSNRPDYIYKIENGTIVGIEYQEETADVSFKNLIPQHCQILAYTLAASQPNMTSTKIIEFLKEFEISEAGNQVGDNTYVIENQAVCKNVTASWKITIKNCGIIAGTGILVSQDENNASYIIDFKVEIMK